jgi:hypothetical protein
LPAEALGACPQVSELFQERASFTQGYDTGRFAPRGLMTGSPVPGPSKIAGAIRQPGMRFRLPVLPVLQGFTGTPAEPRGFGIRVAVGRRLGSDHANGA